jgi:hypothetical protein
MTKKSALLAYGLPLTVLFTSCVNLSQINTFATASVTSLQTASSNYTYAQSYQDFDCRNATGIYYYPQTAADINQAFGTTVTCNADSSKKADQILSTMNQVISAYLTALGNLSDSKAVNYNFSNLTGAIDSNSLIQSKLSITTTQWTSLGKIATTLSNDLMNAYRKKKLKDIITKTDPDFQIVLAAYIRQMQGFEKILGYDSSWLVNMYDNYFIMLFKAKTVDSLKSMRISSYEASLVYQDYLSQQTKIQSYKSMTDKFIAALQKIKDGHATLAKDVDRLNEDAVKQALNQYSTDISGLTVDFNSLKSKK